MGAWEDAYQRATQGKDVREMSPREIRAAERRARAELDALDDDEDD